MRGAAGGVLMVSGEGARSWSCLREAGAIEMTKATQPSWSRGCRLNPDAHWIPLKLGWSTTGVSWWPIVERSSKSATYGTPYLPWAYEPSLLAAVCCDSIDDSDSRR